MNNETTHCCNLMDTSLENPNVSIMYVDCFRQYGFPLFEDDGTHDVIPIKLINYCPWCTKELPKNYRDHWFYILNREYQLDDPLSEEQLCMVPEEFSTDEWWKNRGL